MAIEIKDEAENPIHNKTPHKCPVCGGNGLASNGFYNQTSGQWSTACTTPDQCRSCFGTGIVWELKSDNHPQK